MSYEKYERGRQHLNGGHEIITYENKQTNRKEQLTPRLIQSNKWVGVDHAARIHLLNSPSVTSSVEKNKMINDSDHDDDDVNNNDKRKMILDMYEQCKCKM